MSTSSPIIIEQPCYTLINLPQDAEQPSEMKLKEDLEKGDNKVRGKKYD
jgi:coatomer subunit beta